MEITGDQTLEAVSRAGNETRSIVGHGFPESLADFEEEAIMELAGNPVTVISSNLSHIEFVTPEFQTGEPILTLSSNRGSDSIHLLIEGDSTIYFIPETFHLEETSD